MTETKKHSASVGTWIKRILIAFAILFVVLVIALRLWQAEWKPQGETTLKFENALVPFVHSFSKDSLPFVGSAALDIDGDGVDEVFIGGGRGQEDQFFKYRDGRFYKLPIHLEKDKTFMGGGKTPGVAATHGAAHLDVDEDGRVDLFTAGEDGVWLHMNKGGTFESHKIDIPLNDNTTPLSIALGDVNKDGFVDLYISGYIKNDLVEGQTIFTKPYGGYSALWLNTGDNTWKDVTEMAGVLRQHNTFTATFADLDNDGRSDLVIAQDTGVIEIYKNTSADNEIGFVMAPVDNPTVSSYPMGIAVGDYDNNGVVDIYASNVGHTLPSAMLRGDLPKDAPFNTDYILLKNTTVPGDKVPTFVDTARDAQIARLGFGWGTVFADMNMDGHLDILASQNYAKMPLNFLMKQYCGKLLQNDGEGHFTPVGITANALSKGFGITPLIADYNGDGYPDIVWVNIDGPAKAHINDASGPKGVIIPFPDTTRSLNARVEYETDAGIVSRQVIAGQGLGSDQTRTMFMPPQDGITLIYYLDGRGERRKF